MDKYIDYQTTQLNKIKNLVNLAQFQKIKNLALLYGIDTIKKNSKYIFINFLFNIDYNKNTLTIKYN